MSSTRKGDDPAIEMEEQKEPPPAPAPPGAVPSDDDDDNENDGDASALRDSTSSMTAPAPNRRRSSVSAHILWGGRLNDWRGTEWFRRRSVFRILMLVLLVGVALALASLGLVTEDPTVRVTTWTAGELAGSTLRFAVDKCTLSVREDASTDGVRARLRYTPSGEGVLQTVLSSAGTIGLEVVDRRELGSRYLGDYSCRVDVAVQAGLRLPDTEVELLGHQSSSVVSDGVQYKSLAVLVRQPRSARLQAYISGADVEESVALGFERGTVFFEGSVGGNVTVTAPLPTANVFLRLHHDADVEYDAAAADSAVCLTSGETTCSAPGSCRLAFDALSPPAGGATLPTVTSVGQPFLQVMASAVADDPAAAGVTDDYEFVRATSTLPASDFDADGRVSPSMQSGADRVREAADADVAQLFVEGPGSPPLVWQHSDVFFYLVIPPSFLDIFSWGLLTPSVRQANVTLQAAFCPGLHLLGVTPGVRAGEPFQLYENAVVVRNEIARVLGSDFERLVFSDADSTDSWSGDKLTFERASRADDFVAREVSLQVESNILATIVLGAVVASLSAAWIVYVATVRLPRWAHESLEEWGASFYGADEWEQRREETRRRASIFFFAEFCVGMPGEVRNYARVAATVLVHVAVVVVPVLPVAIGLAIFFSDGVNSDTTWFYVAAFVAMLTSVAYVLFGFAVLVVYYLDVMDFLPARLLVRFHSYLTVAVSFLSIVYLTQVFFWCLLGIAVKPNTVLPVAAIFLVLVVTVSGTVRRVRALYRRLRQNLDENGDVVEMEPAEARAASKPSTYEVKNIKKLALTDLLAIVKKSDILEIAGNSLAERIFREIVMLFILLSMLGFLGVGFFVLSRGNSAFVSGLTTAAVFVVGGGVNVPLALGGTKAAVAKTDAEFAGAVRKHAEKQAIREAKKDS